MAFRGRRDNFKSPRAPIDLRKKIIKRKTGLNRFTDTRSQRPDDLRNRLSQTGNSRKYEGLKTCYTIDNRHSPRPSTSTEGSRHGSRERRSHRNLSGDSDSQSGAEVPGSEVNEDDFIQIFAEDEAFDDVASRLSVRKDLKDEEEVIRSSSRDRTSVMKDTEISRTRGSSSRQGRDRERVSRERGSSDKNSLHSGSTRRMANRSRSRTGSPSSHRKHSLRENGDEIKETDEVLHRDCSPVSDISSDEEFDAGRDDQYSTQRQERGQNFTDRRTDGGTTYERYDDRGEHEGWTLSRQGRLRRDGYHQGNQRYDDGKRDWHDSRGHNENYSDRFQSGRRSTIKEGRDYNRERTRDRSYDSHSEGRHTRNDRDYLDHRTHQQSGRRDTNENRYGYGKDQGYDGERHEKELPEFSEDKVHTFRERSSSFNVDVKVDKSELEKQPRGRDNLALHGNTVRTKYQFQRKLQSQNLLHYQRFKKQYYKGGFVRKKFQPGLYRGRPIRGRGIGSRMSPVRNTDVEKDTNMDEVSSDKDFHSFNEDDFEVMDELEEGSDNDNRFEDELAQTPAAETTNYTNPVVDVGHTGCILKEDRPYEERIREGFHVRNRWYETETKDDQPQQMVFIPNTSLPEGYMPLMDPTGSIVNADKLIHQEDIKRVPITVDLPNGQQQILYIPVVRDPNFQPSHRDQESPPRSGSRLYHKDHHSSSVHSHDRSSYVLEEPVGSSDRRPFPNRISSRQETNTSKPQPNTSRPQPNTGRRTQPARQRSNVGGHPYRTAASRDGGQNMRKNKMDYEAVSGDEDYDMVSDEERAQFEMVSDDEDNPPSSTSPVKPKQRNARRKTRWSAAAADDHYESVSEEDAYSEVSTDAVDENHSEGNSMEVRQSISPRKRRLPRLQSSEINVSPTKTEKANARFSPIRVPDEDEDAEETSNSKRVLPEGGFHSNIRRSRSLSPLQITVDNDRFVTKARIKRAEEVSSFVENIRGSEQKKSDTDRHAFVKSIHNVDEDSGSNVDDYDSSLHSGETPKHARKLERGRSRSFETRGTDSDNEGRHYQKHRRSPEYIDDNYRKGKVRLHSTQQRPPGEIYDNFLAMPPTSMARLSGNVRMQSDGYDGIQRGPGPANVYQVPPGQPVFTSMPQQQYYSDTSVRNVTSHVENRAYTYTTPQATFEPSTQVNMSPSNTAHLPPTSLAPTGLYHPAGPHPNQPPPHNSQMAQPHRYAAPGIPQGFRGDLPQVIGVNQQPGAQHMGYPPQAVGPHQMINQPHQVNQFQPPQPSHLHPQQQQHVMGVVTGDPGPMVVQQSRIDSVGHPYNNRQVSIQTFPPGHPNQMQNMGQNYQNLGNSRGQGYQGDPTYQGAPQGPAQQSRNSSSSTGRNVRQQSDSQGSNTVVRRSQISSRSNTGQCGQEQSGSRVELAGTESGQGQSRPSQGRTRSGAGQFGSRVVTNQSSSLHPTSGDGSARPGQSTETSYIKKMAASLHNSRESSDLSHLRTIDFREADISQGQGITVRTQTDVGSRIQTSYLAKPPLRDQFVPVQTNIDQRGRERVTQGQSLGGKFRNESDDDVTVTIARGPVRYSSQTGHQYRQEPKSYSSRKVVDDASYIDGTEMQSDDDDDDQDDDGKTFRCVKCNKTFDNEKSMKKHARWHEHVALGKTETRCDECEQAFVAVIAMSKHYSDVHMTKSFTCETCGMTFQSQSLLTKHIRSGMHFIKNTHKCNLCNSAFTTNSQLTRHRKTKHPNGVIYSSYSSTFK